jgi:hypothetical protein
VTTASRRPSDRVLAGRGPGLAYLAPGLAYPRRGLVVPLLALLCIVALLGCASDRKDGPPVVRTKIDYDSTRDGPRPQVVDDGLPAAKPDPSECDHIWEAVPRGTHAYPDPSDPLGMAVAICTPVVCTKCGLVRHECQKRTKKRR